jgi:hypothetical protein
MNSTGIRYAAGSGTQRYSIKEKNLKVYVRRFLAEIVVFF